MLLHRSRILAVCRFYSSKNHRPADSDDDFLFSNENIESSHIPKSNTLFRRTLRFIWKSVFYGGLCLYGYTFYMYKYNKDFASQPLIYDRMVNAVVSTENFYKGVRSLALDPPLDKLLPDLPKMPPGYMTPKTLVLDLRGTILSAEYEFGKGYVIMKRPGLTEFLQKMVQMYEVVVLCEEDTFFTNQLLDSLDANHRIFSARMGRECLCYRDGELVKELKFLNRDLKNIVVIDKNSKMIRNNIDNAILLPEFTGDKEDRELIELIPFLEHLIKDKVPDVREEIKKFGHVDTGKKYLEKLQKIRDSLVVRQQTGLGRLLTKKQSAKEEDE